MERSSLFWALHDHCDLCLPFSLPSSKIVCSLKVVSEEPPTTDVTCERPIHMRSTLCTSEWALVNSPQRYSRNSLWAGRHSQLSLNGLYNSMLCPSASKKIPTVPQFFPIRREFLIKYINFDAGIAT
ncbi:hypothetical protein J6590_015931 [Homalodisca vitripennis]|nr:hypothetical protein J6590_015931 [Homalodisca vitripennis]